MYKQGEYAEAARYYNKAMNELERHIGKTGNYDILMENRDEAIKMAQENGQDTLDLTQELKPVNKVEKPQNENDTEFVRGLDICRKYYEEVGAPMIHEKFPKYETRISVGLVGEGLIASDLMMNYRKIMTGVRDSVCGWMMLHMMRSDRSFRKPMMLFPRNLWDTEE